MRGLSASEQADLVGPSAPTADDGLVVPWQCTYICPELAAEPDRTRAIQAMLQYSNNHGSMIGFDCVPITSAETIAGQMGAGFATMLAAMSHAERLAAISESAATEFRGWCDTLPGAGLRGPEVRAIALPADVPAPDPTGADEARRALVVADLPLVLCVGSHEPRKNHLAVLHAAEILWSEDLRFSLAFIGGNAWRSEAFTREYERLAAAGRPVRRASAVSDGLLFGAYRIAHCLVFPSLNEGFGLPVAEALASGTPVITSRFGSMSEIAAGGGALLVNPRDDLDLRNALRTMITDADLYRRLQAETAAFEGPSWDDYADRTWEFLAGCDTAQAGARTTTRAGRL